MCDHKCFFFFSKKKGDKESSEAWRMKTKPVSVLRLRKLGCLPSRHDLAVYV